MFKESLKHFGYMLMVSFNAFFIYLFVSIIYEHNFESKFGELLMLFLIIFCFYKNCKLWFNKHKEEINKEENFIVYDAELHEELLNNPKYINKDYDGGLK